MSRQTVEKVEKKEQTTAEASDEIKVVGKVLLQPRVRSSKYKLCFSPYAWAKIRWIRDYCGSEIAGFGISSMDDPFYMDDFRTVKQQASTAHFEFNDDALNDYLSDMFDEGKQPGECMRLWVHTHPTGNFAAPSNVDEKTFSDAFGNTDWAMMIIVDEGDNVYARLHIKAGVSRLQMVVPTSIECQPPFKGADEAVAEEWQQEADANITRVQIGLVKTSDGGKLILPGHHHHHGHRQPYGGYYAPGYEPPDAFREELFDRPTDSEEAWENIDLLIMGQERVVQITTEKNGDGVMVLLNSTWLIYSADVTPKCRAGSIVTNGKDIADVPPKRVGELSWRIDKKSGVETPVYDSEVIDGLNNYFDTDESEEEAIRAAIAAARTGSEEGGDIEVIGEVRVGP